MSYWDTIGRWINTVLLFIVGIISFDTLFRLLEAQDSNVIVRVMRVFSTIFLVPFSGMFGDREFVVTALVAVLGYALIAGIALSVLRGMQATRSAPLRVRDQTASVLAAHDDGAPPQQPARPRVPRRSDPAPDRVRQTEESAARTSARADTAPALPPSDDGPAGRPDASHGTPQRPSALPRDGDVADPRARAPRNGGSAPAPRRPGIVSRRPEPSTAQAAQTGQATPTPAPRPAADTRPARRYKRKDGRRHDG